MTSNFAGSPASTPPPPQHSPSLHRPESYASLATSRESSSSRVPLHGQFSSPIRHHQRVSSHHRKVKETPNARAEYSNSEDDGASQLRINQYLITQEIGRGSFGAVHLAVDQYGQEYAVKEFSKTRLRRRARSNMLRRPRGRPPPPHPREHGFRGLLDSSNMTTGLPPSVDNSFDLIKEEIAIMKKLHHPNLVSLIEVLDDPADDSLFMVLEMCKRGVIMKIEPDEEADPYSEEECRTWFRDLILGIEYLHAQGVIHRDIKPDNCLLTDDGMLKVSDFGVSEMFEKASDMRTAKSAGSPAFMAPELCRVTKEHISGAAADIWSMGVTLYCMRFGKVPYQKTAVLDLYNAVLNDPVQLPEDCDRDFRNLMMRLMEKDANRRIKMPELREHPWVTRHGSDPLLPTEENCADLVEPPTEAELSTAITGNLGRVMAVMKAVNRFKSLLERRRPGLVNSILGHASRLVRPPLQMSRFSSKLDEVDDGKNDDGAFRRAEVQTAKAIYEKHGDTKAAEITERLDLLPEKLRTTVIANLEHGEFSEQAQDVKEDVTLEPLTKAHTVPLDAPSHPLASGPISPFTGRGQAHNPLEDVLFLDIGGGPGVRHDSADGNKDEPEEDIFAVSESPGAAELNIYEEAYTHEVSRIQQAKGREATIYLTRRVEKHMDKLVQHLRTSSDDDSPATSSIKRSMSGLVDKALEKTGYSEDSTGQGNHRGLSNVFEKAMAKAHYTPDQTEEVKQNFTGIVGKAMQKANKLTNEPSGSPRHLQRSQSEQ